MKKAYAARQSTINLVNEIRNLDGIERVTIIAPRSSAWESRGTMLRVQTQSNSPEKVYTDFTLPEARQWLASERG